MCAGQVVSSITITETNMFSFSLVQNKKEHANKNILVSGRLS